jgi:photosystem II stability/assembly factor-like uncharacterized protein
VVLGAALAARGALAAPLSWQSLGPTDLGGQVQAVVSVGDFSRTVYAGVLGGGIWKSVDAGDNWTKLSGYTGSPAVGTLAADPNGLVLYAGTGDDNAEPPFPGTGVYKTSDGGATWRQLPSTVSFGAIYRIVVSEPVVLVSTSGGLMRSPDGGTTWSRVGASLVLDACFRVSDNSLLVVVTSDGILYSNDLGQTWQAATGAPTDFSVTDVACSRGETVYAASTANGGTIYRSDDSAHSFAVVGAFNAGLGFSHHALWMNSSNAQEVVVGGDLDVGVSVNAGQAWTSIGSFTVGAGHVRGLASYMGQSGVYAATDRGVFRAANYALGDGSPSFYDENHGLAITQFLSGAGNATNGMVIGGSVGIGVVRLAGQPAAWRHVDAVSPESAGACLSDPAVGGDGSTYWYGMIQTAPYFTWQPFRTRLDASGFEQTADRFSGMPETLWGGHPPLAMDPSNPQRLYAGGRRLWRLENARTAAVDAPWSPISDDHGSVIESVAVAPSNPNVIWYEEQSGEVWVTSDGLSAQPTWRKVLAQPTWGGRVYLDGDGTRAYVSYANPPTGLWRTTDGGTTWSNAAATIFAGSVRALAIDPRQHDHLYAGGDGGVFSSSDAGITWSAGSGGFASAPVMDLFWVGHQLYAATYGAGMFRALVDTPPTVALTQPVGGTTFKAGATITLTAAASDSDGHVAKVEFFRGSTKIGEVTTSPYTISWTNAAVGAYQLSARATDDEGVRTTSAAVNVTVSLPLTRTPAADAYVRDGSNATKNFGTATSMQIKTGTTGSQRDAFIRLDISGFTAVSSAKLALSAHTSDGSPIALSAYAVSNTSWGETSITWNNKPLRSATALATQTVSTAKTYTLDLTTYVKERIAAKATLITIGLHGPKTSNGYVIVTSREATSGRPSFTLTP